MPNTKPAIIDHNTFEMASNIASQKAHCDYALYLGATPNNAETVVEISPKAAALKMYLNETFTELTMKNMEHWKSHIEVCTFYQFYFLVLEITLSLLFV